LGTSCDGNYVNCHPRGGRIGALQTFGSPNFKFLTVTNTLPTDAAIGTIEPASSGCWIVISSEFLVGK
jgi:hypothetical protein